jgi:hypothetical protein
MLNHAQPLNRRRALLLAAGVATVSTLAYAAEGPPPAAAGAGYIEMQLKVERSRGGEKTSIEARIVGRDGERVKLRFDAIASDTLNWTTAPLWIHLQPQKQGNAALIKTQIEIGEPTVEIGHPSVMSAWGTKARIEIGRADSDEKFALELTPTAMPADFQPPKNTF